MSVSPLLRKVLSGGTKSSAKGGKKIGPKPNPGVLTKEDVVKDIHLNTVEENTQALKNIMARQGTGTMLDAPIAGIRAIPPIKKLVTNERYKKTLNSYQTRLNDADRAAGEYLASKNKVFKSIFTADDMIPKAKVITESGKKVDAYVPTQVSRLSAPLDKTKHFAIPMMAVIGLDNMYENTKSKDKEGDFPVQKAADVRESLINKLADVISKTAFMTEPEEKTAIVSDALLEKIAAAAGMLKQAHSKIASLENTVACLTGERDSLKLQIMAKERSQRAVKLAKEMVRKGMIKQAELQDQEDFIMGLNDETYNILRKTVENVPSKQATSVQNGLDKVSYIVAETFDDEPDKPSLGDAIVSLAKTI